MAASLGACRQLCGPTIAACPCEPGTEYWIVDIDPSVSTVRTDAMANVTAALEWHGGTCLWCVETTLCVRWQRSLNDSAETAWSKCSAPPKEATRWEAALSALAEWLNTLIQRIQKRVQF